MERRTAGLYSRPGNSNLATMGIGKKIRLVILLLFGLAAISILGLQVFNRHQVGIFTHYSRTQVKEAAHAIRDINETHIYWVAYDYGLWDGMVDLAAIADTTWARENLGEVLYWFDLSALWVLNLEGEIMYSDIEGCAAMLPDTTFSASLLTKLYEERYVSFYTIAGDQLLLVQGASIHPTGDEYRESDPRGFLFMAMCYDETVIGLLGRLTGGEVTLHPAIPDCPEAADLSAAELHVPYDYWDEEGIACLAFRKNVDFAQMLRQNALLIMVIMTMMAVLSIALLSLLLRKWVTKPLGTVGDIIAQNDLSKVSFLKQSGKEFRRIGILIEQFISQKEELRIAKERAEESDKLKSAFLANVSHEIRTPMSGVTGFAELLRNEDLTREQRMHYTDVIIKSGEHLISLIDDVLDLSAIESGHVKIRKELLNLENLLLELQSFYLQHEQVREKQLDISIQCEPCEKGVVVHADRLRLKQLLMNLVGNAVKFTEEGGVQIGCQVHDDGYVHFYVRDTGPGIPEEYHQMIFDRFAQVHTYYSHEKKEGTGLGLSICKGLVELMGGRIWVESTLNKGATFHFTIPANGEA